MSAKTTNMAPYSEAFIVDRGWREYHAGVAFDDNPYNHVSLRRGGLIKAAWWDKGWNQAQRDAEEARQT